MLPATGTIYEYVDAAPLLAPYHRPLSSIFSTHPVIPVRKKHMPWGTRLGIGLMVFALGGMLGPLTSRIRLEAKYLALRGVNGQIDKQAAAVSKLPPSVPLIVNPLVMPDGSTITPVNTDFALVIPKVGINAAVSGSVDPKNSKAYMDVLKKGIAHASTSMTPGDNGTVYLFSHSTNYEWFVKDLNAVFYLLKNLDKGDSVVVYYKGRQYVYVISDKKVVKAKDATYLYPLLGKKQLILQTCWPPGSTAERMLLFADQIEETVVQT